MGKCGRGFEEEAELLQHQENHAGDRHCNGSAAIKRRGRPPKTEAETAGEKKAKQKEEEAEGLRKPIIQKTLLQNQPQLM